eukprot:gene12593-16033_t
MGEGLVPVPDLTGMSRTEVINILSSMNLGIGFEKFENVRDSSHATVTRQYPSATDEPSINVGEVIDVCTAMAQHPIVIEPMVTNPQLAEKHALQTKTLFPAGAGYYFFDDTLSLPFIDDFSKDRFKDFRLSQYTGIYQQTLHYFSTVNYAEQFPDSVWYLNNEPDSFIVISPDTFQ